VPSSPSLLESLDDILEHSPDKHAVAQWCELVAGRHEDIQNEWKTEQVDSKLVSNEETAVLIALLWLRLASKMNPSCFLSFLSLPVSPCPTSTALSQLFQLLHLAQGTKAREMASLLPRFRSPSMHAHSTGTPVFSR
jgi:hypothetical protein